MLSKCPHNRLLSRYTYLPWQTYLSAENKQWHLSTQIVCALQISKRCFTCQAYRSWQWKTCSLLLLPTRCPLSSSSLKHQLSQNQFSLTLCRKKSENLLLNNLHPSLLCLSFTLNFWPFLLGAPSFLSALTGLILSYPTSNCSPLLHCSDIIFHLPNCQTSEFNSSSLSHEPPSPSIICLAKEVVAIISWCCVSFLEIFCIFSCFPVPEPHTHLCGQSQSWGNPREGEGWITAWGEEGDCRPVFHAHNKHLRNLSLTDQGWRCFTSLTKGLRPLNPQLKVQAGLLPSCIKHVPAWKLIYPMKTISSNKHKKFCFRQGHLCKIKAALPVKMPQSLHKQTWLLWDKKKVTWRLSRREHGTREKWLSQISAGNRHHTCSCLTEAHY